MLSLLAFSAAQLSAGIGAGLSAIGAGLGIGMLAAAANEGIARQPESTADIRGNSIIFAALVEGVALFALVINLLLALAGGG